MPDDLPTIWPAKPHTLAKHAILKAYLDGWFPILSRQARKVKHGSQEILFIDGFAGPGEYKKGEPGSPVIALRAALQHSVAFPVPVRFLFIEQRDDRCRHLNQVLKRYSEQIRDSENVSLSRLRQGDCDIVLETMLDEREQRGVRFGPALAFLDQFGYSAVSMRLIRRILAYPQCEVFSYLDYKGMNRWIEDPAKAVGFTRTYGSDEWREAIPLPEKERRKVLLDKYQQALRKHANAKYVYSFEMFDKDGQLLYWLTFCTHNLRGLEVMKNAMWKVDKTGQFRFSDKDHPGQVNFLNDMFTEQWLAEELSANLAGKTMTVAEVREYVLKETPCYKFKKALRILETEAYPGLQVIKKPANRRRGQFAQEEEIVVRFPPAGLF